MIESEYKTYTRLIIYMLDNLSNINKVFIEATVECNSERMPTEVLLRIPHPTGKNPVKVTGGIYNTDS